MKHKIALLTVLMGLCISACTTKTEDETVPQPIAPEPAINGTYAGSVVKYYRSDYSTTSFTNPGNLTATLNAAGVLIIQGPEFHLTDSTFTEQQALSTPEYQHYENQADSSRGKKLITVKYYPVKNQISALCTIDGGNTYQFYSFTGTKN